MPFAPEGEAGGGALSIRLAWSTDPSSRTARTMQNNPVLKNRTKQKQTKEEGEERRKRIRESYKLRHKGLDR